MNIEELLQRIVDLENQMSDLRNQKDSATVQGKLNLLQMVADKQAVQISELQNFVELVDSEDRFIETFSKSEIKVLYNKSGVTMPDVAAFISKLYDGKKVDLVEASSWISGDNDDIRTVSRIGKYLRKKALQNAG